MRQTRRQRRRQTKTHRRSPPFKVQHHHALLRIECNSCPDESDASRMKTLIETIVKDIHMKLLGPPQIYTVLNPDWNEGLTGIAAIETSHIAFHFWKRPERKILHTKASHCLLELDIYTCGSLTPKQVAKVLHHLTRFSPQYADCTILNRKWGLSIERHMHWNSEESKQTWVDWLQTPQFQH